MRFHKNSRKIVQMAMARGNPNPVTKFKASPPPPARLFFLPDAAHAWREEEDGATARLGVQHLSNAYFRKSLEEVSS
jgi:hypothetical protein